MKRIIFILSILVLFSTTQAFACLQSLGKSGKDKQVAAKICNAFGDNADILMVSVQESILYLDISKLLYDDMMRDKLTATKLVKNWMESMRNVSGKPAVTVWVYVDKIKVIEADTAMWTGEDKIKFLL